ncbi:2-hydroxychromene-2-carboxylate isomerase [Pseudooceanicola sp. HF7]|uniref:2-hydroxychromene-2-carboxylate isomerase n=1 Tax=Pseudooceanicola sp. HF7 TaxID=2721560 RepID=UPI001431109D|nr:2-hydroxychromene-2-carboxylate isomerase [Pseudooceanicola sp. HF7]NIZ07863.1 2-hydroxychromene-2-carboxylate isomerase [Pseudooceanicola sp. HF7]
MAQQIDYYLTPVSPFTYLAGDGLERIAAAHGAQVTYKPVNLGQVFAATGGVPLPERAPARQAYRLQELRRIAARTGLPINLKPKHFPTNPAPASYAIIAAQAEGGGDLGKLVQSLLAACWAEEKDIAEDSVIGDCLAAAGFDRGLTMSGLLTGAETFERFTEEAIAKGVFGSPFYIVDEKEYFWGQDRLGDLELFLEGKI